MPLVPLLLTSPLLERVGVPHCFTTRVGGSAGVSHGIFSTLNFGNPSELPREQRDPPENIAANLAAIASALNAAKRPVIQVHQVHGAAVHHLSRESAADPSILKNEPKADAIVTNAPVLAGVRTADCAPILLASSDGSMVGAVHAGWRGVIAGVLPRTIEAMRQQGARDIVAAIGPCIGPQAFEVGAEVAEQFVKCFGSSAQTVLPISNSVHAEPAMQKFTVDLQKSLSLQLVQADVMDFDIIMHCTFERQDLFFSHRREKGLTGRMIALIGPAI